MLSKLDQHQYLEIKAGAHALISQYPLINAVVSNVQDGQVYADIYTGSFFVVTKAGFSLLNTPHGVAQSDRDLFEFLKKNHDIPNYIHIYSPTKSFEDHITVNWNKFKIRKRAQFRRIQQETTHHYETLLSSEYRIAPIQEVDFYQLEEAFKLDFSRRYWNSREDFISNAVGACILNANNKPVAICYSACVVDGIAEMDTLVLDEYRGRKFMRIVSEPFFNITFLKGLTPHWDTFVSNTASYVMAQNFGLKAMQEYNLLSLLLR